MLLLPAVAVIGLAGRDGPVGETLRGLRDSIEQLRVAAPPVRPAAAPAPAATEILWLAEDNRLHRAVVDAGRHAAFAATVAAAIGADRQRLQAVVGPRVQAELDTILLPLESRTAALADEVFSVGTGYDLVMLGLRLVGAGGDEAAGEQRLRQGLDAHLLALYDDKVLQPPTTQARVKAAVRVAFADTRRDLLRECDKFDQAFQDFVTREARQVTRLDPTAGWVADDGWKRTGAGFRSLCHAARLTDTIGPVVEPGVYDALSMAPGMAAMTGRLTEGIAAAILETQATADGISQSLAAFGVPAEWTIGTATVLAAVRRSPALLATAGFDEPVTRPEFLAAALASIKAGRTTLERNLAAALRRYVDLELTGIAARLSLPSDEAIDAGLPSVFAPKTVAPSSAP